MFTDLLNLSSAVTIIRHVEVNDTYGGLTTTTTSTVLAKSALWRTTARQQYVSGKDTRFGSYTLAYRPTEYTFNDSDKMVSYGGNTYSIEAITDDVMQKLEVGLLPLELLK